MKLLPTIAKHAKDHNITALKALGQNFIFDMSLCEKIARSAKITEEDIILEVGPGTAGLTRSIIAQKPRALIAIEKDKRFLNLLADVQKYYPNLEIIEADAITIRISDIIKKYVGSTSKSKVKIIANLPYNIATPLIMGWLDESDYIESINIMLQREVADRICSQHSKKSYGRLSIICQLVCEVQKLFDVSPESFYPRPKIWSSVISLIPREKRPAKAELELLSRITHDAFCMRRKMLKTSLKNFTLSDFDPNILTKRAEDLEPSEYLAITKQQLV